MKIYKIKVRLEDNDFNLELEAENWGEVCDYVFGRIEVIDLEDGLNNE